MERVRLGAHLWRCAACRERLVEAREQGAKVAALLANISVEADLEEAWQRLQVRRGARTPRGFVPAFSFVGGGVVGALAFALALVVANDGSLVPRVPASKVPSGAVVLRDHCCSDRDGDGIADDGLLVLNDGTQRRLTLSYRDLDGSGDLSEGDVISAVLSALER
jgi:hypothetical protein